MYNRSMAFVQWENDKIESEENVCLQNMWSFIFTIRWRERVWKSCKKNPKNPSPPPLKKNKNKNNKTPRSFKKVRFWLFSLSDSITFLHQVLVSWLCSHTLRRLPYIWIMEHYIWSFNMNFFIFALVCKA